ncbi:MAG: PDZ domain-containing protein [Firmicutes bacterium]|nr:PDZ domain-containing protein [Bacillota bacterium]
MFPWRELAELVVQSVPAFLQRGEVLIIAGVVLLLVLVQYQRLAATEQRMFGQPLREPFTSTLVALGYGLAGGVLGTALFLFLGISLVDVGVLYLWLTAILLMAVHPRFVCFAYAGGLLSLTHLLFGWPELNVPAVMGLVAVLHLVEALLIWVHGPKGATPVYIRRADGRVVGGFTLQKFWPLPFIALIGLAVGQEVMGDGLLAMPDWWPLIGPPADPPPGQLYVYILFPVVAALGYGDLAVTRRPHEKARRTAGHLLLYSLVLMGLAVAGSRATAWQFLAALMSPLGHELVIYLGRRSEEHGEPVLDASMGAVVLGVVPGSPAASMGLRPGDVIRRINGFAVERKEDVAEILSPWAVGVTLEVENVWDGDRRTVQFPGKVPPLGVILAPAGSDPGFMEFRGSAGYGWLVRRIGRLAARLSGRR